MIHTLSIEYIVRTLTEAENWESGHREMILYKGKTIAITKENGALPFLVESQGSDDHVMGWFATPAAALTCICNGFEPIAKYESIVDVMRDCKAFTVA